MKKTIAMIFGGILNGLALFTTSSEELWNGLFRMWCLFLLTFGFCRAFQANWVAVKEIERRLNAV